MTRYFQGDRLFYAIEDADANEDASIAEALLAVERQLASLSGEIRLTIVDDPRQLSTPASAPAQPAFLQRVDLKPQVTVLSQARRRLIDELSSKIDAYLRSKANSALVVLLDGPPGTGKTTIAREVARRIAGGVETFRPTGLQTQYIGETAKRITEMFALLRSKRVVLIWDDLDRLFSDRGSDVDSAAREHRDVLAAVFEGLDESRVVIIGSTNATAVLDDAFLSRVKIRKSVPAVEANERAELLRTTTRGASALTDPEIQEIVEAAPWMSFRDIETFCQSLPEVSHPIPRIVEAWRNTFADRLLAASWSRPQLAERHAERRIWDVEVADAGHTAWFGTKDNRALGASILAHGQLAQMNEIKLASDVSSVCYDRRRDLLLLGTDKELCVVGNARATRAARAVPRTGDRAADVVGLRASHGAVWDARWITDQLIVAVYGDGTIALCRYDDRQLHGDLAVVKIKSCRNVRWIGRRNESDFLIVGCEEPSFPVIRVDRVSSTIQVVNGLPYPGTDSMKYRRVAALPRGPSSSLVAVPNERGVAVYQWAEASGAALVANIAVADCRTCAFDLASPRFAIAAGNEIQVFSSFARATMEEPRVVNSPSPVTALAFGRLGQSLIWGTDDGGIFSATTM